MQEAQCGCKDDSQEGGRKKNRNRKNKQQQKFRNPNQQGRNKKNRRLNQKGNTVRGKVLSISELAGLDRAAVMNIVATHRIFKVDAGTWTCDPDQKGGADVECERHFDPKTGHSCGKRSRCFQTHIQDGASETIKQRMDGVATKIFVRQNLLNQERFGTFLHSFNAAATNLLKQLCTARSLVYGKDVVLAFKGGNVMRLVLMGVLDKLPAPVRDEWVDLMQIGDMDFEVFIDNATELMVRDTTVLMLYVLYSFRVFMEAGGWTMKPDAGALEAMISVVPAVTSLVTHGYVVHSQDSITVPYTLSEGCDLLFVPVNSVLRSQDNKRDKLQWLQTDSVPDTALNISMNRSLSFGVQHKKGVAPEADIVLLRMKHGLRVVIDAKCGAKATAEVIDVSIPTNRDRMHRIKSQDKKVSWFTLYEFVLDGRTIQVHAPSLDNFVLDLHMFMFVLSEFPWFDPKQAKRMKRYFWFCTMLRSQQGASPATIDVELASVARVLLTLTSSPSASGSKVTSSLARRTAPWAELLSQMEATRTRAGEAGLVTDWTRFVQEMRSTALSVKLSYSSLASAQPSSSVPPAVRASSRTRGSLALAAISATHALSLARLPHPA